MAKRGGARFKGESNSKDGPLPTLENEKATKHQTMIDKAASEAWTDAEIAIAIYDVTAAHFSNWVTGEEPSDPAFLEAYQRAKALRSKAFRRRVWNNMDDVHESTAPDGTTKRASRANTGLYSLWARNVENWRVTDPKESDDAKPTNAPALIDGGVPDVG